MKITENQLIICGTDFSEPARAAADAAVALASRFGVPLRLVHASEIPASPLTQELLETEARRLHEAGANLTSEVVEGSGDEVLVRIATQHGARLIVVASLGRRKPSRWLLGSVAERTAESAPVPTLVVRDAGPFQAWARGDRALKVFVGTDFTASADAALRWVADLQKLGSCEVTAGFADWTPQEASRLGVHGPLGLVGNPLVVQDILERDVKAKVTSVLGVENVHVVVQGGWGRTEAQLAGMASEAQADIMVVGTHQRHGLSRLTEGSVSRGLLHSAPMNVLCVPVPDAERMAAPQIHECQRVLVAVDLNEMHGFAVPYAYGIASAGARVLLMHNVVTVRTPNALMGNYFNEFTTTEKSVDQVAQSEPRLRALAPPEAEARRITTEVEITRDRETAQAICAAAERFNADVVCIGSHTRPGLSAKVLGSVSQGVLQQCRRPVLVVWPPAE